MGTGRDRLIGAGLAAFRLTRLHRALAPLTRGRGAILAFHHVRPPSSQAFQPNGGLSITPEHLDAVLHHLRRGGTRIVPLDAVPDELAAEGAPFVALTFDDGYRDNVRHALPVLERHEAPFTVFVTTGFADRSSRLWWLELEEAVRAGEALRLELGGRVVALRTRTLSEKHRAFAWLARHLRNAPPVVVDAALAAFGRAPAQARSLVDALCLDWDGIARLAAHPLAAIGCHTLSHPCLAALNRGTAQRELEAARAIIAGRIGRAVRHLAYPYGSPAAAGSREFALAAELGFATAVTTRPGVLHEAHRSRLTALPRISVNGLWPRLDVLDILLSGAPFALRRLTGH
ncbi:MAG: polysaccharide deacetylase family protein [Caulobacteraceae bacterium]|nr:polysaccharide deacetylase family protein [Caulobacter sp.]